MIVSRNFSRINSITTNTCATQKKAARILASRQEFQKVFFVPCDSHGLQLLIKNIVELPWFNAILKKAQSIVTAFTSALKQLGLLRNCMRDTLGKVVSFALSVITRWGTQVAMFKSLQCAAPALQKFYTNLPSNCGDSIKELQSVVWDRQFWVDVDFTISLLTPIDELIKMSESDHSLL